MNSILMLIPTGRENAISMKLLAELTGMNCRELRRAICKARINGTVICASDDGYFCPESSDELRDYYKSRYTAAMTTLRELKAARRQLISHGVDVLSLEGRKHGKKK